MTPYHKRLNPLVQRMAEDMTLRNLSPRTIDAYTWHVDKFCQLGHKSFTTTMIYLHVRRPHLGRSPSPFDWLPVRQCPQWVDPQSQKEPRETETDDNPDNHPPGCE